MRSPLSAAAPSSMVRVLDFMRQKDHHALLDADAEVREAVAVHAALSLVRLLRTGLKRKQSGVSWLRREVTVCDRVCEEAVAYMALRRVAPRQLVEDDGGAAPLRRLLVEAVRPAKVVYMSCVKGAQRAWGEWLVQLLGVAPSDCCCTRVVLQADDGEEAAVELRFQHGRFPTVEGLSRGGWRRARASSYSAALAGHAECLHFLRSVGIAFTDRTSDGAVAVQAAAFNDDVPMLKLLYSHPKAANEKVIKIAARHGRLKMVQELCERGADMRDAACSAAQHNRTEALQLALTLGGTWDPPRYQAIVEAAATRGHIACLQVLHRAGIDMTTAVLRRYEASAAFEAAREGQVEVLRYFHSIGFDLRWPDYHFLSMPVYVAAAYGRNDCVRFLCDECPGVVTKKEMVLAAFEAAFRGKVDTLKLFLERGALEGADEDDRAQLVRAAANQCGMALE